MSYGNAYDKRTFGLAVARSWQWFPHRTPRKVLPIREASLLATTVHNFRMQVGDSLLADLAPALADRVEIPKERLRTQSAARSTLGSLSFANAADLGPDTAYEVAHGGPPMSFVRLSHLIKKFEFEEVEMRGLLALADARLADDSRAVCGSMHRGLIGGGWFLRC